MGRAAKRVVASTFLRFLGLDPKYLSEVEMQACHLYTVKRAMDIRRHRGTRIEEDWLIRLLWEGHKTVSTHSAAMRRRYARLWMD